MASDSVTGGFEYALRLNSILPKYGDPAGGYEIEIEGGVFSLPPDQYESVEGIVFDGTSWIETGFNQIGSTKVVLDYKYAVTSCSGGAGSNGFSGNMGLLGSRGMSGNNTVSSFVVWACTGGNMRTDYGSTSGLTYAVSNLGTTRYILDKDDGVTKIFFEDGVTPKKDDFSTQTGTINVPVEMLIGSLSHAGAYGTNGTAAYSSFQGTIYGAKICKTTANIPAGTVSMVDNDTCGSGRVLVRDLKAAKRDDGGSRYTYGFYDMVTGEFIENAGFGTFTPEAETTTNELEVSLDLKVEFVDSTDSNNVLAECTNAYLVTEDENQNPDDSGTKIRCTVPESPLIDPIDNPEGKGRVDVRIYANDVLATAGSLDADDFYYGAPMVIDRISPYRGSTSGGQVVTITGNNFFPDDNPDNHDPTTSWQDIDIRIGGSYDPLTGVSTGGASCDFVLNQNQDGLAVAGDYTNTSLTCTTSSHISGIADVYVYNGREHYNYGGSIDPLTGNVTSGYLYEEDLISIDPNTSLTVGGGTATITGNGFITASDDSAVLTRVYFGTVQATGVIVDSSTQIRVTIPPHAPGTVNITVLQGTQGSEGGDYAASFNSSMQNAFTYEFEGESGAVVPSRGYISGGDTVIINGEFDQNAINNTSVTFGGIAVTAINSISPTQIEVVTPAGVGLGLVDVVVTQYSNQMVSANAFTYIPPLTITSISPDHGPVGGGTEVTITGVSFLPPEYNNTATPAAFSNLDVWLGTGLVNETACAVSSYTDTQIICTTGEYEGSPGVVNVRISVGVITDSNRNDTMVGALDPITGAVLSGYRYVTASLSLAASMVQFTVTPGDNDPSMGKTGVIVETNNPDGYNLTIRADDSDEATENDNWLKCTISGSTDKLESIAAAGPIQTNTWGWGLQADPLGTSNTTAPTTWQPVPVTDTPMLSSPIQNPSAVGGDKYDLWFGAKAGSTQRACVYESTVIITLVVR